MSKDMTAGNPMRLILKFFIPVLLGSLFQQFYSMVDTIIVGKFVGVNALAGVGATGSLNFLVIGFAMGITIGFGVMIGQKFGAKDLKSMRSFVTNGFYLIGIVSAILMPLMIIFCKDILRLLHTPDEIFQEAYLYIVWIFAGMFLTMLYNAASAILRAIGDSRTPLFALILASLLNIVLDLLFVVVFKMGTVGVAVATVIAQGISGILCVIYMFIHYEELHLTKEDFAVDFKKMKDLLRIGIPMALQFSITALGGIVLQGAVNTLGAISVAAMTAGGKISTIFCAALESVGTTMATYCSQNLGAGEYGRIRQGIRSAFLISIVICIVSAVIVLFAGNYVALLFIDSNEGALMEQIQIFLRINAVFYPALAVIFVLRNSIQAMGYSFVAMFAGVSEMVARVFVAFTMVKPLGFLGVTWANPAAWVMADLILVITYVKVMRHLTERSLHTA